MNIRRDGDAFVVEEEGSVLGSARPTDHGGIALELAVPREGVALALIRAIAAERGQGSGGEGPSGSLGSVHLQTDDQGAVAQLVARLVPRVFRSPKSIVSPPRNGWVAVYDEVAEGEPQQLARLARELSSASGLVVFSIGIEHGAAVHYIAFERGRIMDEYNSVPELGGPLPPGDAIALRANPTVVARLTGANAASVRAVARSVASPDELPDADELIRQIAEVIGLEGAHYRAADAENLPDAVVVEHE
jgi:hypothetical protein